MADIKLELPNCTTDEKLWAVKLYCKPVIDRTELEQKRLEYLIKKGNNSVQTNT